MKLFASYLEFSEKIFLMLPSIEENALAQEQAEYEKDCEEERAAEERRKKRKDREREIKEQYYKQKEQQKQQYQQQFSSSSRRPYDSDDDDDDDDDENNVNPHKRTRVTRGRVVVFNKTSKQILLNVAANADRYKISDRGGTADYWSEYDKIIS